MHRKIIEPLLTTLDHKEGAYFSGVADYVEKDPSADGLQNLVFLVLKQTIPLLPTYLPAAELAERLIAFTKGNHGRLNGIIHDRRFLEDPDSLSGVTNEFVHGVLKETLDQHDMEEESRKGRIYRFGSSGEATDFPYADDDDIDAEKDEDP